MNKKELLEKSEQLYDTIFKKWQRAMALDNDFTSTYNDGMSAGINEVIHLVRQLDEPETLSQEWIDGHQKSYTMEESVGVSDLHNLLIPKREKPVIPQFVADDIEEFKRVGGKWDAEGAGTWLSQEGVFKIQDKTKYWLGRLDSDNFNTFFSVLSGVEYEVEKEKEKEPLYYVEFVRDKQYLNQYIDGSLKILSKNHTGEYKTKFTESEIKAIDKKYWPFAERVQEDE